jgi:hypothetical protein
MRFVRYGLNPTIAAYIEESNAQDIEALTARFKTDAVVTDEGHTHRGIEAVRRWIKQTHEEYHFRLEALDFTQVVHAPSGHHEAMKIGFKQTGSSGS